MTEMPSLNPVAEGVVGQLVRGRERCRQLIQLYRDAYNNFVCNGTVTLPCEKACLAASQLLVHLRAFAGARIQMESDRSAVEGVLTETSDLLQGVLVIERELRESLLTLNAGRRPTRIGLGG